MDYTIATIIILIADQVAAQDLTTVEYFTATASETGENPATHCFMTGPFSNNEMDVLTNAPFPKWVRSGDWQAALASMNLQNIPLVEETPNG